MTPEQIRHARDLLIRPENTVSSIARLIGVSRSTIYKYVPEITRGNQPAACLRGVCRSRAGELAAIVDGPARDERSQ
jgi:transposase-like protein